MVQNTSSYIGNFVSPCSQAFPVARNFVRVSESVEPYVGMEPTRPLAITHITA